MGLIDIVTSLLPGNDRKRDRRQTRDAEADTTTEATIKGTDQEPAAAGTDAAASTGSLTEEPPETPGDDEVAAAAEPAEAAGPEAQVEEDDAQSEGADDAVEADPTGEEAPAGADLESVSGIGQAYANRLRDAGVDDVEDLLEADAAALAEETGVGEARIQRWQDRARED